MTRLPFTEEEVRARQLLQSWMAQCGLQVRIDAAGNVIGRRPGRGTEAPAVTVGSHVDTVANGGRFDGALGVLAGLEVLETMNERGLATAHPVELIVFAPEEANRFGFSAVGSRAMAGKVDREVPFQLRDGGETLAQAWERLGARPAALHEAAVPKGGLRAFVELHIEQGVTLEQAGAPIGIVRGIVGIGRLMVTFRGRGGHSGTVSMTQRNDALVAMAEVALTIETVARAIPPAVGTVGRIVVEPNQPTIIPTRCTFWTDLRAREAADLESLMAAVEEEAQAVAMRRRLEFEVKRLSCAPPVHLSEGVQETIHQAAEAVGARAVELYSGAGHDASHMAEITETGMIFVPCRLGISHDPAEWTEPSQAAVGAEVLLETLLRLAG